MNGVSSTGYGQPSVQAPGGSGPGLAGSVNPMMSGLGFGQGAGYGIDNYGNTSPQAQGDTFLPTANPNTTQTLNQMSNLMRGLPAGQQQANPSVMGQPGIGFSTLGNYFAQQQNQQPQTVSSLYQNILGREADQGGLDYWTQQANNGMSMNDIRDKFLASEEFATSPVAQQRYQQYVQSLAQPAAPAPVETQYTPVTTTFSAQPQAQTFNAPVVTQAAGDGGGAVNYQYNRGGIASLVRR